jgi:hypothetical protein
MIKGQKIEIGGETPYQKWIQGQGIPIIREFYIEDLRKVELQNGAYVHLRGLWRNQPGSVGD